MNLNGVFTALVTPFRRDLSIDEEALRALVDFQIEEGVTGLVPMGTTGESPTLDHEEHERVVEIVVDQANGRVPVIAGAGSNSTAEAVNLAKYAAEIGADATLQVAPYYNKPTPEGFYRHFAEVSEAVDLPMIIYNIPSRTGKNIDNETMLRIARLPNVAGVKEASGDMLQVTDLVMRKPDSFVVLSGDDNLGFPIICLGGNGIVSVASNVVPGRMAKFVSDALAGNIDEARMAHYELLPLFQGLFLETNPIPVKLALALQGKMEEVYRLPMCPMGKAHRETFTDILKRLDIL